jgi:hypothetical protein
MAAPKAQETKVARPLPPELAALQARKLELERIKALVFRVQLYLVDQNGVDIETLARSVRTNRSCRVWEEEQEQEEGGSGENLKL